jgi:DNA-binding CsgD family transcriptional regulator
VSWQQLPPPIRHIAQQELTPRQLDALKLHLNGWGSTRIALALDISEPRARALVTRAIQKLAPHLKDVA